MKTLVTGGAGFIGSHLVDRLVEDGHDVVVLDDLSKGREENLARHRGNPRVSFHRVGVADKRACRPHFGGVEWVFHIAGRADIVPSIEDPLTYFESNVSGTVSVLECAREAGAKRFVYAASSSCYGVPDEVPTPETAEVRTEYPYALTKYLGECCVLHWSRVYGLPAVSLRFFNVYGPRSRTTGAYGAVFGVFLAQKIKGHPFTVVGDGTQTRDFVFVTDVAEACALAAGSDLHGEVLNVGAGSPQSVNRLVELLGGEVVYVPKRPGEPDVTHADISRIREKLGWEPRVSFEAGVSAMMESIDLWQEAPLWTPDSIAEATREWFEKLG